MGFAEELRNLDPEIIEQAYARASEKLLRIAAAGTTPSLDMIWFQEEIKEGSFGLATIIGQHEIALQMMEQVPAESGIRDGQVYEGMLQMRTGILAAHLILLEYARLETAEI